MSCLNVEEMGCLGLAKANGISRGGSTTCQGDCFVLVSVVTLTCVHCSLVVC